LAQLTKSDFIFAFLHADTEWNDSWAVYYDQDIRAMGRDGAIWKIDLKSDDNSVTIIWKQIYEVPKEYMLMLVDPIRGASVDLRQESVYTVTTVTTALATL
jgi:hypothetical protein